jgi:LemA protein
MKMAKDDRQETKKKLSTGWIVGIVVIAVIVLIILSTISLYNGLVRSEVNVDNAWGNVQVQYQRRADLIPNLVETVKGAADFEQGTLTEITAARSAWTNARTPEEQVAAANGMESALSRLMVVVENYPTLTATQNFQDLQAQLEGTENRVSVERQRYNTAVQDFNTKARVFPTNIVAGMFGFKQRTFFASASGAENAPVVVFLFPF